MKNHFNTLGLAESFAVDIPALEQCYFRKQQECHPDRQAGKGAAEKQRAILLSMEVNQAYQTLKDPLLRAQHLLELQGIKVNTDGQDSIKPTPELLMEMMTLREEVAECQSLAGWEKLHQHGQREWAALLVLLQQSFDGANYSNAALQTIRLRYLEKFLEELRLLRAQRIK